MIYFIILLCVGMVVGPLLAALPSPRQRAIAALRDIAGAAGVRISFRQSPNIPPRMRRLTDLNLVCYSVVVASKVGRLLKPSLFVRSAGGWESRDHDTAVPELLINLPADAEIVAISSDDISVYWDEQGDVNLVVSVLKSLHPDPELR